MKEVQKLLSIPVTRILAHFGISVPSWKEKPLIFCPFHEESRPSFIVNVERNFCYCFGCQRSWDGIQLIREKKRVGFFQALEILAQIGGLRLSQRLLRQIYTRFQASWQKVRERQESDFYHEFALNLACELSGIFHKFSTPKPWHIYLYCFEEFDILVAEPLSRWKFDQLKDWFHRTVKVLKNTQLQWKKLPVLIDEAWRERVEI